jgi:hypothetical protein
MNNVHRERIALLIEALESGRYTQGQGRLARRIYSEDLGVPLHVEYCCLGVACEVAIAHDAPNVIRIDDPHLIVYRDTETGWEEGWSLPDSVAAWYDFEISTGVILDVGQGLKRDLIFVNDDLGWSFGEIAAALRERFGITADDAPVKLWEGSD